MNGPVPKSVPWIVLGLVVVLIVVWATSGGEESTGSPAVQPSWAERADAYCSDGLQETVALPLPATAREVAADADARIGIVATVRDGIYTLGDPDAGDEALAAVYVRQLDADLGTLDAIATAARQGGDYTAVAAGLDESAGRTASQLGLGDCAALSQAIARTP